MNYEDLKEKRIREFAKRFIVNIEVQVAFNDNPVYRMRYNQSALTISHSPIYQNGGIKMLNGLTKEFYEVAKNDGINQGIEQGHINAYLDLLNQNLITEDIVMQKLNITKEELNELIKKYK